MKRCTDTHFVVNFFLFLSYLSFIPLVHVQQLESVLCLMMWTRSMVSMDTVLTLNCTIQWESSCLTAFPSCFAGEVNCALYNMKKKKRSKSNVVIKINENLISTWLSSCPILHWDALTVDDTRCLTVDGARFSEIYQCCPALSKFRCFYPTEVSEFQRVLTYCSNTDAHIVFFTDIT